MRESEIKAKREKNQALHEVENLKVFIALEGLEGDGFIKPLPRAMTKHVRPKSPKTRRL